MAAGEETPMEEPGGAPFLLRHAVGSLLAEYGWYILFICVAVYLLVQKLAKRFQHKGVSRVDTTAVDPDVVVRRQEAVLAARKKMQEELDAQAEKFKEKQKLLEEEKRRQKIAMWESMQEGKSYKETLRPNQEPQPGASTLTAVPKPKPKPKRPLREGGYNPLSGDGGGSCSWRPGRRGPSSGG